MSSIENRWHYTEVTQQKNENGISMRNKKGEGSSKKGNASDFRPGIILLFACPLMPALTHVSIVVVLSLLIYEGYAIWPKPAVEERGSSIVYLDPSSFEIYTNSESKILQAAVDRYKNKLLFPFNNYNVPEHEPVLESILITVKSSVERLQLGFNESYSMYLQQEHSYEVFVNSPNIWGAMRALETFSQFIEYDVYTQQYSINQVPFNVEDEPRFPWRGLMIDTSRHYLEPLAILRTLDAMSYSKFNTLHWHITDAESFPFVVESFPNLSDAGAYSSFAVYPPVFIKYVVAYAKERAIRVVIETDMPGHAYCWGDGYPKIRANCPGYQSQKDEVVLNPIETETYQVINGVLDQISDTTEDNYVHLGGDEVQYGCWTDDVSISQWMEDHNLDTEQLGQIFYSTVQKHVQKMNKTALYWEDISSFNVPDDTIFEVYSSISMVRQLLQDKKYVINSYGWYLDMQMPISNYPTYEWVDTWKVMWYLDPLREANVTASQQTYFLGGEALMWGDDVDATNIDSRVWPRASAVADRLWSTELNVDLNGAKSRLIDFRCRLARRGIGAGPLDPDYCPLPPHLHGRNTIPGFQ